MMFQWFTRIDNPFIRFNSYGDVQSETGLLFFLSNIVKFITVAAGLFAFFNLVIAGFTYVTSGSNKDAVAQAWARINFSLIGLVLIVAAFLITAVVSQLLFGRWDAILQPTIYGPGGTP